MSSHIEGAEKVDRHVLEGIRFRDRIEARRRAAARIATAVILVPALVVVYIWIGVLILLLAVGIRHLDDAIQFCVFIVAAILLTTSLVWAWRSMMAWFAPPVASALWLRKFNRERGDAFRVSDVISNMHHEGFRSFTLQDRDVRLSWRQRAYRWRKLAMLLGVIMIVGLLTWCYAIEIPRIDAERAEWDAQGRFYVSLGFERTVLPVLLVIGGIALAVVIAPLIVTLADIRRKDDFRRMSKVFAAFKRGRGPSSTSTFLVSDEHWQQAVQLALTAVDAVVIDVSEVSEAIAWEVEEASRLLAPDRIVFIAREATLTGHTSEKVLTILKMTGQLSPLVYPNHCFAGHSGVFRARLTRRLEMACRHRVTGPS